MELVLCRILFIILLLDQSGGTITIKNAEVITITRLNNGDSFAANGAECNIDTCVGFTSGTASLPSNEDANVSKGSCSCQCHQHIPTFREDLRICVDDIHECVLAPFVSGSTSQKIPFVFLPLKGQIIHPSREINFIGIKTPICAVSGSKYLTENGWKDLRNTVNTNVPFQLFIDEGRTFLQWTGETELRTRMTGRLILVHLLCRDASMGGQSPTEIESIFTPCVAFRVVGTPLKYLQNVSEVVFSADAQASEDVNNNRLSVSEYIAIGVCSILLGLIYVASVFLYLHIRKQKKGSGKGKNKHDNAGVGVEEGIIKSNPLLGLSRHFTGVDSSYSDSGSSDTDITPDLVQNHYDRKKNIQTSALVHPQQPYYHCSPYVSKAVLESMSQDSSAIERLPEENVSIVETMEGREERPDSIRAITGTTRKKLYFNPAYFEPELLLAPPPAALEFLIKIREVIAIAKQKMACKKFSPSLLGIPEEESSNIFDSSIDPQRALSSRRSSMISLKRENSRRRTCTGCPACEPQDLKALCGKLPEFPSLVACQNCTTINSDSKQRSIQKWLEDVPTLKLTRNDEVQALSRSHEVKKVIGPKRVRSPTRSLSPGGISTPARALSPKPASERARSPSPSSQQLKLTRRQRNNKSVTKPKAPLPPVSLKSGNISYSKEEKETISTIQKSEIPTLTRNNMKAVISQFSNQRSVTRSSNFSSDSSPSPEMPIKTVIDYDVDSLERSQKNKGNRTPTEYCDLSSQPSPSLSSALPMTEEMTIQNAVLNTKTGNMTVGRVHSKISEPNLNDDYELIVVRKGAGQHDDNSNLYSLPDYFQNGTGYSLVSEVYYEQPELKPGRLTIEVEDCPNNYIRIEDCDNFEPDTLDRKPSKRSISSTNINSDAGVDGLYRSGSILLRTTGSFKHSSFIHPSKSMYPTNSSFQRTFRSLREIYEFKKTKHGIRRSAENLSMTDSVQGERDANLVTWRNDVNGKGHEGKLLTLQERHLKRQRRLAAQNKKAVPPDVIPPPPHNTSVYDHPKPPRKIIIDLQRANRPPLPPKNGNGRSTSQTQNIKEIIPASPHSEHYSDVPSVSLSGTSVSPNSSDYEIYNSIGEAVENIHDSYDHNRIGNLKTNLFRNASINNRFALHAPRSLQPFHSLKAKKYNDDNNNNIYTNQVNSSQESKREWYKVVGTNNLRNKVMDSGYLSTDSNDSHRKPSESEKDVCAGSETDESLGDGHSESGGESVETHSVFFGTYRNPIFMSKYRGTIPESMKQISNTTLDDDYINLNNMDYATVVPVDTNR
ncbi:hypothetical protein RI129_003472 [Pyrocoelia pectoralis]|uniref:Shavenoid isoform B-like N-terminal domain-containing protein n=1 Tax=Pyrocoelia pectoralis TaxID=417401 RepID=A0AAN7VH08_9COLE